MKENIVKFPNRKLVEQEAAAWLVKLDGDSAPYAGELEALHEWLNRSPDNREELSNLATFWGKLNVLTELAVPLGQPQAAARTARRAADQGRVVSGLSWSAGLIAAALIVVSGVAFLDSARVAPVVDSNGLFVTMVGQQQSTTLVDGSVILLNTDTRVRVAYDDQHRDIYLLQGEAHFTVRKDNDRPFRVYVGDRMVQAVGTAFSVYLKDSGVDVTVTEGQVALATVARVSPRDMQLPEPSANEDPAGEVATISRPVVEQIGMIRAGESASIRNQPHADIAGTINTVELVEPQDMARRLSWRNGMLVFNGEPLEVVAHEISRYTTVSIEFSDPAVRATRIGGQFPIGEIDAMFDALEANFELRVTRISEDRVLVSATD